MIVVRNGQQDAFREGSTEAFLRKMTAFFGSEFPEDLGDRSEPELRNELRPLFARARNYGFETEGQVFIYLWAAIILGGDFDSEREPAREILRSKRLTARTKALWLSKWTLAVLETEEAPEPA